MVSDATAYERGVNISQTGLIPNFREGVQANPWFQLGYQMGLKHGARAAGMMSRAKSEFPAVAARLQASRPGTPARFAVEDRFYFGKEGRLLKSVFGGWTMDFGNYKMLIGRIEAAAKKLSLVGISESDALINEARGVIESVVSTLKSHRTSSGLPHPMETDKIRSLIQSAIKKLPTRKLETLHNKAVDRYYSFGDARQRRYNPSAEKAFEVLSKIGDQQTALENLVKYLETVV